MSNQIRAALYARVSSDRQADRDLSIPAQLKALREYARKQGWIVAVEFVDEAESARTADRPQFQRMIAQAKQKQSPFTVVMVWKLSRFARNREDSILYKAMLRRHGVQVVSINEPIEDTPTGKLFEGLIETIDEFYSANLSQDTVRGMNENASQGFLNGGRAPFGYRRIKIMVGTGKKAKLEIVPEHAAVVKRIFSQCLEGKGVKEIAKKLNADGLRTLSGKPWTNTVLYYMLTNEAYTGTMIFNGYRYWASKAGKTQAPVRVENTHPVIVSKDDFAKARAMLKSRAPNIIHPRSVSSEYLLSGIAYCGACGSKLGGTTAKSGKFTYYGCQRYLKQGREACSTGIISQSRLEEAIFLKLKDRILTEDHLSGLVRLVNEELAQAQTSSFGRIQEVQGRVDDLRKRLDRLYGAIETGEIALDALGPRIKELQGRIETTEAEKRTIEAEEAAPILVSDEEVKLHARELKGLLLDGTLMERKAWLRTWIKRVTLNDKKGGVIEYRLPLVPTNTKGRSSSGPGTSEVLSIGQIGCR